MKQLFIILLLIGVVGFANAQKADTTKKERFPTIIHGTVSMYLKIPAEYKVVSCRVGLSSMGDILQKENIGDKISAGVEELFVQAVPGDVVWFDDVIVVKDGKQSRWPMKKFLVS